MVEQWDPEFRVYQKYRLGESLYKQPSRGVDHCLVVVVIMASFSLQERSVVEAWLGFKLEKDPL